jgi:hypothetical protein
MDNGFFFFKVSRLDLRASPPVESTLGLLARVAYYDKL